MAFMFRYETSITVMSALFGQATLTTVPAGKRLVVEYRDGRAELPVGQRITIVRFSADVSPFLQVEHCFGADFQVTRQAIITCSGLMPTLERADMAPYRTGGVVLLNYSPQEFVPR